MGHAGEGGTGGRSGVGGRGAGEGSWDQQYRGMLEQIDQLTP